ncbi:ROK family protein [Mucilaginibacter lacusdianchii]|uniref:ROK family protein n=1 Tax=Mucilaginibacter lacusdianchii TaxID=2684211 RepID=UPI00131C8C60|nr:ROK family protein [Mucilaginibacter sp. JXJ CY 39]
MSVNLSDYIFIGVDIGGSHITAAHVMPHYCSINSDTKVRLHVDSHGEADYILNQWAKAIIKLVDPAKKDSTKIGIAMPGPFNYSEGVSLIKGMNKYESLYGMNVREALSDLIGIEPDNIMFRNDAEAFLHGEVVFGKMHSSSKVIGVTLGTGLGSAKSANGITTDVFRAITPMHDGIAEDYISTRWFLKRCNELTGRTLTNVEELLNDSDLVLKERLLDEFGNNLGTFLNNFAAEEQADVVILGGNIAKGMHAFGNQTLACITNKNIIIKQSTLWEDAALIGAACSWPEAELLSQQVSSKASA